MGLEGLKYPTKYIEKNGAMTREAREFQLQLKAKADRKELQTQMEAQLKEKFTMGKIEVKKGDTLGSILQREIPALRDRKTFLGMLAFIGSQLDLVKSEGKTPDQITEADLFNPHYLEIGEYVEVTESGLLTVWDSTKKNRLRQVPLFDWTGATTRPVQLPPH